MDLPRSLDKPIANHAGVVTRAELRSAGLPDRAISRRLESGLLVAQHRGVFRLAQSDWSHIAAIGAAVASCGTTALAARRSAAVLLGLLPAEQEECLCPPIEVAVPFERALRRTSIRVVRMRSFDPTDGTRAHAIPCVSATRSILDLAPLLGAERTGRLFDEALRRRLTTVSLVAARHAALPRRGRAGVRTIDALLAQRAKGRSRGQNELEAYASRLLVRAGLEKPTRQLGVTVAGGRMRYLDLAYPSALVAIETDGYEHHAQWSDWAADQVRSNELVALGWRLIRATWAIRRDPEPFVSCVREALSASHYVNGSGR